MDFLKHISSRGSSESWSRFCAEVGADLARGKSGRSDRVIACFEKWTITLDTIAVAAPEGASAIYTRMRVPYISKDGFRFRTRSRKIPYWIRKKLPGMQSIEVGDPELDHRFIIKGNNEPKLRTLFASPRIRQLIQFQPSINLEVRHDRDGIEPSLPDGVDQLYFCESGIIRDVERLKSLHDLFAEILDHLCRMGSASGDKPGFVL